MNRWSYYVLTFRVKSQNYSHFSRSAVNVNWKQILISLFLHWNTFLELIFSQQIELGSIMIRYCLYWRSDIHSLNPHDFEAWREEKLKECCVDSDAVLSTSSDKGIYIRIHRFWFSSKRKIQCHVKIIIPLILYQEVSLNILWWYIYVKFDRFNLKKYM